MVKRRLILMRHAKSSWKAKVPTDHARGLNRRGRGDAPRVARRMVELGWVPDYVLSSDATRARETVALMLPAFARGPAQRYLEELYHAGVDELRACLSKLPDDVVSLLALGHNPGWEEALAWLSNRVEVLKTACAALLVSEARSWHDAVKERGRFRVVQIIRPRELTD